MTPVLRDRQLKHSATAHLDKANDLHRNLLMMITIMISSAYGERSPNYKLIDTLLNPVLEPTSTEQLVCHFLLKETTALIAL